MRLSVIVSTYNSPESLLKTLVSLDHQTFRDFEVVIADDGSGYTTCEAIQRAQSQLRIEIRHLWHEDRGFRKNTILNKSVLAADGDYLVFLDGDCVARSDLIGTHAARARPGQLLSGGSQIDIPIEVQRQLNHDAIAAGLPFDPAWLASAGATFSDSWEKRFRLGCRPWFASVLDRMMPRSVGFVGCNSSAWKDDILRVNGFDEEIAYGVDDKDLGVRLINAGIRSRRMKYSLVYIHLDHRRTYADQRLILRNKVLVNNRRLSRTTWIDSGINKNARQAA